jgi:hypothetical protein
MSPKAPIAYYLFRLCASAGITSRAVKANGPCRLCPLVQRCYVRAFLRHLQLLPVLLRGDAGAAERHAYAGLVGVRGGGGRRSVRRLRLVR